MEYGYNGLMEQNKEESVRRLPEWLKRPVPQGKVFEQVTAILDDLALATVCSSAACPNLGECFSCGTATFMIMGSVCTRNCRFCAVEHGQAGPLSEDEPTRLAEAVERLKLRHVVITSVTRDDLADGGAEHFARTIRAVHERTPEVGVEVLTPDFGGDRGCIDVVCGAGPEVFNHNIETTRRLTPEIRSGADYECSLGVLRYAADRTGGPAVKSGFMLGLGEREDEIDEMLADLRGAKVAMLTVGQYLRPGKDNREVAKYYTPDEFAAIGERAKKMGFEHVAAGPFVRSSYHAAESMKERK